MHFSVAAVRKDRSRSERGPYQARRNAASAAFRDCPRGEQLFWLEKAANKDSSPPAGGAAPRDGDAVLRSTGFLCTWNGSWGLDNPAVQAAVRAAGGDPLQVASALAAQPCMQHLLEEFWRQISGQARELGFVHVSVALELSTRAEDKGRVHMHAFVSHPVNRFPLSAVTGGLRFGGAAPSHAATNTRMGKGRYDASAEGHYYLQVRKTGVVGQRTNFYKGIDFRIRAGWIRGLWCQRKLTHANAKLEAVESRDRAFKLVDAIDKQMRLEADVLCRKEAARLQARAPLRPFKPPTAEEVMWLAQYGAVGALGCGAGGAAPPCAAGGAAPLRRFKTLVYDGPSRTGKSERAMAFFGADVTLAVNCQGVKQPCLHQWLSGRYRAILYDEADWQLLWWNRLLFQAGEREVLLGQSNCNEHAYTVLVYAAPMIVTSNDFWGSCPRDGPERQWIEANIVYRYVGEPTWMDGADTEAQPLSTVEASPPVDNPGGAAPETESWRRGSGAASAPGPSAAEKRPRHPGGAAAET